MSVLPILKQNAYLTLLIKDNFVFANLAYSDLNAQRTYVLSDKTDLSPLKFRLDDSVFTKDFWFEYFDSLEKEFDWDIVDRTYEGVFNIKQFVREEVGVSGIRVLVDDNQPFFHNIFRSIKEFSKDIALKILDDRYIQTLSTGIIDRMGYDNILWLDLDISHFSVYRTRKRPSSGRASSKDTAQEVSFTTSKIDWSNEIGLIDFVKSSKLQAFLGIESCSEDISNRWANLIAHNCEYLLDPVLHDILRAFSTLQLLSLSQSNEKKMDNLIQGNSAIFVSGNISGLLSKRELLFSIIDGLELEGVTDLFIDKENRVLTLGKSMVEKELSSDIIVLKGDILPKALKVIIPDVPSRSKNKIIFKAQSLSQNSEPRDIYALGSLLQVLKLPDVGEKAIIEGELTNGAVFSHLTSNRVQFLSSKNGLMYEYLVVDGRHRPIVYGPSAQNNRVKFRLWGDGDKE